MTNIAICGANGKMGKNVFACADGRDDCKVIAGVDVFTKQYADFPIVESPDKLPEKPDVIIDFSNPALLHIFSATVSLPELLSLSAQPVTAMNRSHRSKAPLSRYRYSLHSICLSA